MKAVKVQEERMKQHSAALHGGGGEGLPADREIRTPSPIEKGVRP